jgi:membrane-associated phospholipid phosphatase
MPGSARWHRPDGAAPHDGSTPALAPRWAAPTVAAAAVAVAVLTPLVWHTRQPNQVDAWVMSWQEVAYGHAGRLAGVVTDVLMRVAVAVVLASAGLAWRARRLDAMALAITAVPTTLVVNRLLKEVVHRQPPDGPLLLFPSGHLAMAAAAVLTAVLVVRVTAAPPGARRAVAWLAGGFLAALGATRLAETIHYLTDVLAGAATGLVVTLAIALAIMARWRTGWARVTRPAEGIDPHEGDLTDQTRT